MSEKDKQYRIIISGGGTGGHIYPAIAIADRLKEIYPQCEILFVGAKGKMEMQKVPEAGYSIEGIWISGLQRKNMLKNILFPVKLISSLRKASAIIKKFQPAIAIGVGGYASGPLLWIASRNKIPTLIQEQNSLAGITNKLLSKKVDKICVAYENMDRYFPGEKIVITGNPVRKDILKSEADTETAYSFFNLSPEKKTIFVMGGSLGARTINLSVLNKIHLLKENNIQLIWQIGKFYYDDYQQKLKDKDLSNIRTFEFLKEINLAYSIANVIISRAGALSVSELCIAGKPVVFVPSPNVAEDHQTKNAESLVKTDAALMVKDEQAREKMIPEAISLLHDQSKCERLGSNIKKLAIPDATDRIIKEIQKLLN